jgi:hypothetical protein
LTLLSLSDGRIREGRYGIIKAYLTVFELYVCGGALVS